MTSPYIGTCLTMVIYFAAVCSGFGGLLGKSRVFEKSGAILGIAAFLCQTLLLVLGFHKLFPGGPSGGAYLQLLAWFILLCGILAWLRLKTFWLILFATPLSLLLFILSLPYLNNTIQLPDYITTSFYTLHIGSLFLSLGLFSLAALAGCIFLFIANALKNRKKLKYLRADLPALALLDQVNSICVLTGFPLYTLGLITGFTWSKTVFGSTISLDPKEFTSLFIWILLAILFHNRLVKGWSGRKPALISLFIFILCLFSILVVNFYFPTHHAFIRN